MPVMTTALPAESEKSSPSLTLPLHTAKKTEPEEERSSSLARKSCGGAGDTRVARVQLMGPRMTGGKH